jgi:hypothetical protein
MNFFTSLSFVYEGSLLVITARLAFVKAAVLGVVGKICNPFAASRLHFELAHGSARLILELTARPAVLLNDMSAVRLLIWSTQMHATCHTDMDI